MNNNEIEPRTEKPKEITRENFTPSCLLSSLKCLVGRKTLVFFSYQQSNISR